MAKLYLCLFSTLINEEILKNIDYLTPAKQQLVGRCLIIMHDFFLFQSLRQAIKMNTQKFTQTPICQGTYFIIVERYLLANYVSIMLHFLDRLNPIYLLRHTVKSHLISLNSCIIAKSKKHFLNYHVNIQ